MTAPRPEPRAPREAGAAALDALDRAILNALQEGFPLSDRPYAEAAARLGIGEAQLIERLGRLLQRGILTRFGPLYHAERLGGALTLCAMRVPPGRFEEVAALVNGFPEVAHNYERDHELNMWFVLATGRPERCGEVIREIEEATGLAVLDLPREAEYYVGLRLSV